MTAVGKKLKALGFKKIPGTEPGFHMFELNPAALRAPQTAKRPSAQARKRTSLTSKQIWDIIRYESK